MRLLRPQSLIFRRHLSSLLFLGFIEDSTTPQSFDLGPDLGFHFPHNRVTLFAFNSQFWDVHSHVGNDKLCQNSHDCLQYQRCNLAERNKKGVKEEG